MQTYFKNIKNKYPRCYATLLKLLLGEDAYNSFILYFSYQRIIGEGFKTECDHPRDVIDFAFLWSETEEGDNFWMILDRYYDFLIKQLGEH